MFNTNEAISRADVMTALYNALVFTNNDFFEDKKLTKDKFTDKRNLIYYAANGASYCVSRDIVHGYNNELKPKGTSAREVAQLLYS